ncbi:hypothetical protein [Paracraurococcus lichenis]|uniref:Uncharacterized protein n=1 Tax=Paracraurococcus lichenis TaxID=3064888 RepID=A0ABT9EA67_9PROT|nr:hypothetical protein [Paracraurococcus sp. LOR1-02]MDO9713098.1 hypothetical protein [Paracraurococcus sp. LOR1-02]
MRPAPGPRVVMPTPMPCAEAPGDILGLVLEGTGAPAGAVTVFGQAFRPGDLPRDAGLAARGMDGSLLPVQCDVRTRHSDGSARFAVVALAAPALSLGQRTGVVLSLQQAAPAVAPLDLGAALAGRHAVAELTPEGGGEPWRVDLAELARAGRGEGGWQSGPLAVQVRLVLPVPPATVGGATSLRLVADLATHADGTLWVDAWLRNDIAMRPGGGAATYAFRLLLDGQEVLSSGGPLRHWQYAGWGRLRGAAAGGGPAAVPLVRHDPAYLAETAAVARYDLTTGVAESLFQGMARLMADPDWERPLRPRGVTQYMGMTGGRPDLGLTTSWQAAWVITGAATAAAFCIGQAEAGGSVPWHFWDPAGGAHGRGGWMDERRWPQLWTDARGGQPPRGLMQHGGGPDEAGGWGPDSAHQPSLSYVPFLLTGRRALLDNLLAQASANVIGIWPALRSYDETGPIRGVNVVNAYQVRSSAWNIRDLDSAAWICPDDDPHQGYLRAVVAANWAWLRGRIPQWTAQQGELHGYRMGFGFGYDRLGLLAPWQQDYFASATAAAARRGNADARAFLAWMGNFIVGRFRAEAQGFARHDGAAYVVAITPVPPSQPPAPARIYTTWAQVGAAMRERDLSNGEGWAKSQGEYVRLALLSLAVTAEVLDSEEARQAYIWLAGAGAPSATLNAFAQSPEQNIVPRGMPREPSRQLRCVAVAAPRAP